MKKAVEKIKCNWKIILVSAFLLAIFVGYCFYINWIWDKQGSDAALPQISLFIAAIVAIVAFWSLKTTRDSLKLTRATQRPFLNVESFNPFNINERSIRLFNVTISNKGNFPADEISATCMVHHIKGNNVDEFPLPFKNEKSYYPSCCFPGDDILYHFDSEGIAMENEDKFEVYITIEYKNKLTDEKHKTIRAYSMTFIPDGYTNEILSPYPKGDDWN